MIVSNVDIRDAFFDEIYSIAANDRNVLFITADADAFSLRRFKQDMPEQFINVGIAEQNMVAIATGLALSGKKVFIYAIIPFIALRCYEHIKVNICGMNLPIGIVGSSAGLSINYSGPTHHAICDIAVMRILPEITILNPCDSWTASACAKQAYEGKGPVYVRLDKGKLPPLYDDADNIKAGFKVLRSITDINIISTGFMSHKALEVANELEKHSVNIGVIDLLRLKPVDADALLALVDSSAHLITLEENSVVGGLGTIISEILCDSDKRIRLKRIALEDKQHFDYGSRDWLHQHYGLDPAAVVQAVLMETSRCRR